MTDKDPIEARHALIAFARAASDAELLASTCGNASLRRGEHLLITGSGAPLAALSPQDLALVDLKTGEHLSGPAPSMETPFHRRAYRERPGATAILHCQSRAATLLACAQDPPTNLDLIPEVPAYVRRFAYAPFALPGSAALADGVAQALRDPEVTVVQLQNHGQVILGTTWREVIRRGVFFEVACAMATSGVPLRTISDQNAAALRDMGHRV